jgi:regulatory protein
VTITRLEKQRAGKRVNVYVDGEFMLAVSLEIAAERGLREGEEITAGHLRILRDLEGKDAAYKSALRLLGYRPCSEQELRKRLRLKKMTGRSIESALARLRRNGLLDDAAFARFYVESRPARSRRLVRYELSAKGVQGEAADGATEAIDDFEEACRAAEKRARRLDRDDPVTFNRRLTSFLASRGFSYGVIQRAISHIAVADSVANG